MTDTKEGPQARQKSQTSAAAMNESPVGGEASSAGKEKYSCQFCTQAELEEVRLRLVKAAKDGKHKYWFAEDGTVNDSGTVTRHHEVVVRTTFRLSSRCGRCRLSWLRRLLCMVQRCRVFGRPKKLSWRRLLRLL